QDVRLPRGPGHPARGCRGGRRDVLAPGGGLHVHRLTRQAAGRTSQAGSGRDGQVGPALRGGHVRRARIVTPGLRGTHPMKWPRMTTRQLMLAAVIVALSCWIVIKLPKLPGIEGSPWGILGVLAAMFGLYLAAALVFGLVLDLIDALLQPRPQPGEFCD